MIEAIIQIIFVLSLGGASFILARKIPVLVSLPQNGSSGIKEHKLVVGLGNKIKGVATAFEKQIFLHKLLSWIKVVVLRIETKVDALLHKIRKRAQEKK